MGGGYLRDGSLVLCVARLCGEVVHIWMHRICIYICTCIYIACARVNEMARETKG